MIHDDPRDSYDPHSQYHQHQLRPEPYGAHAQHSAQYQDAPPQQQQHPAPHSRGPIDDEVPDFSDEALLGTKYVRKSYGRDLTPPPLPPGSRIRLPRLGPIDREIPDFSTKALERG